MTPFNIGKRIELHDFSEAEARVLMFGLERDEHELSWQSLKTRYASDLM